MIWYNSFSRRVFLALILACGLMACSTTIESDETSIEPSPFSPTETAVPTKMASPTPKPTLAEITSTQSQIDENGESITADFLVRQVGENYRVVQMIVNDRESLQSAMSKFSK